MRLIDADALSKDLEKRWNVNDDQDFCNKEVWHALEEAPTIEPDGDTISRRAAILAITGEPPEAHYPSWYAERIKSLPSSEPKTGKWEIKTETDEYGLKRPKLVCSKCEKEPVAWDLTELFEFCPNCGADMRGGEDDE